ncbi:TIGR02688 family protein [Thiocapsa imhoffii]|uniref:TIGR02688 family protein n=1 Tax=Thiocapsa imhoffii TaxID=382777 RepID=A0A9X1BBE8_9GAMM|nr:protease Lon-related BREX system protein BrxL [Thiocapsa imhoffii]MBK1646581.1 TIGR02688 family protein [Thiocapsa imhoffii]
MLDELLNRHFAGKVVRKDLTKLIKEGANVPVYVLEYLLGMYCASDDEEVIRDGMETVKTILAENYVRPDEAEKVKSKIKERGSYKVIDKVTVRLNERRDVYEALLSNLGVKDAEISGSYVKQFEKLLVGGIWCIVTVHYFFEEGQKGSPFSIGDLKPIQMPNMDLEGLFEGRRAFSETQWIDVLCRSTGMEPSNLDERVKWHLLARMVPFVENNYNCCELGPRGTGKSHIYKEISPNSILISGGQTTVANLFYNMARRTVGLVGLWDLVAFDEVAGISFKDKDGVQIMKDFMASGSFARGRDAVQASASMVFVGNINQPVDTLVKTSHLLAPFPEAMIDSAFFDRFHAYIPGWEVPKMRPEFFTNQYGLITDYLAEFMREMRKRNFSDAVDRYFKLGRDLNQRDTIAVRRTTSGLLKLLYPHGEFDKDAVRRCLEYALEARRRVKEQLKKIGGMEFFDVHFSYLDQETREETFISVPEQGGDKLISDGPLNPGVLHTVATGGSGHLGLYRLETQTTAGNGKLNVSGLGSSSAAKESVKVAFDYFKANISRVSGSAKAGDHDYHLHTVELHNTGATKAMTLPGFVALCSGILQKPIQAQMVVLGDMSLGGSVIPVENLAECLQVAFDSGAKRILLPMASVGDIPSIPGELFAKFQTSFYADPVDAVFKALGVE